MRFDRPIFVVGNARAGTTMLASVIHWHSQIGPANPELRSCGGISEALARIYEPDFHLKYSDSLERRELWSRMYGDKDVFVNMGRQLIVEHELPTELQVELKRSLSENLDGKRLLVKSPSLSFKVKSISKMFESAKFLAILRNGEDVVASWGRRIYGFGRPVDWAEISSKRLSYLRGIAIFSRKWLETVKYLHEVSSAVPIKFVSYNALVGSPQKVLADAFDHLELQKESYIRDVSFVSSPEKWKMEIPLLYHSFLKQKVKRGNELVRNLVCTK